MKLDARKEIITGAAQGMKAYFVRRLFEAGARVAAGDVNEAAVAAVPVARIGVPKHVWPAVKLALECDDFNARVLDVDGGLPI